VSLRRASQGARSGWARCRRRPVHLIQSVYRNGRIVRVLHRWIV